VAEIAFLTSGAESFPFTGYDRSLCRDPSGMPSLACLHENAVVNNPPAEDQLGKISCGHVVPVFKE